MDKEFVRGTCLTMCPVKEFRLREREGLLHLFELSDETATSRKRPQGDSRRVVKAFSRSAAGQSSSNASDLRPFEVLMNTINYLFHEIMPKHVETPLLVYDFIFDRLRAVRQDMTIQNLASYQVVQILEPITRFHVYFGYILCENQQFDAHINNSHLLECLKKLLVCYDQSPKLRSFEIESFYVVLNLGDLKVLNRGCLVNQNSDDLYQTVFEISLAWYMRNCSRALRLAADLPLLLLMLVNSHLAKIRYHCLYTYSQAFSFTNSRYSLQALQAYLWYPSVDDLVSECSYYNVKVSQDYVMFCKTDFDMVKTQLKAKRTMFINAKLSFECDKLVDLLLCGLNKEL